MLKTTQAPEAERRAVERYARDGTRGPAGVAAGAPLTLSCRKYTLPLRWSDRSIKFGKPRFVGWQHLVSGVSDHVRISTKASGNKHSVAWVSIGPFSVAADSAIKQLQGDARIAKRSYTVSSLSVSALMVQALWLRAKGLERYWILEPSHGATLRGKLLTKRQFEASLRRVFRSLAADIPSVDNRLGRGRDKD